MNSTQTSQDIFNKWNIPSLEKNIKNHRVILMNIIQESFDVAKAQEKKRFLQFLESLELEPHSQDDEDIIRHIDNKIKELKQATKGKVKGE